MAYRGYSIGNGFIVDPNGFGDFTTIGAALTAASSGQDIFIRSGTYTENPTLKAGVNLTAFSGDSTTPHVTIVGKCSFTGAGKVSISNINLETNSDYALSVTGSSASIIILNNCNLNCSNHTGIEYTSSSSSCNVTFYNLVADIGTTGITLYSKSAPAALLFYYSICTNSGSSVTYSNNSAGTVFILWCNFTCQFSDSSTGNTFIGNSTVASSVSALTVAGTTANGSYIEKSTVISGSAAGATVATSSNLTVTNSNFNSSNTNIITGLGSLYYNEISPLINTGTLNVSSMYPENNYLGGVSFDGGVNILSNYVSGGTFTPTLYGGGTAGTTTYSAQNGYYTRIGNVVTVIGYLDVSAATGTASATIGGLPFTIANNSVGNPWGNINLSATGWIWPTGTTMIQLYGTLNTTTANVIGIGSTVTSAFLAMANAAVVIRFQMTYLI